jgi:pimeloyl-ACP methyl ester carboxylesterase
MSERQDNRQRWTAILKHTKTPLLLINGPADPVSGKHAAAHYAEHMRDSLVGADVSSCDDTIGHYPQLEVPEFTGARASSFWGRLH